MSSLQGYTDADVLNLKEAAGLASRQEALHALRHAGGDVCAAFVNELASLHLALPLVDELVVSYAADRRARALAASCGRGADLPALIACM